MKKKKKLGSTPPPVILKQKTKTFVDLEPIEMGSDLPIAKARDRLTKEIIKNDTIILIGETGCGKTTQVPKYIYQGGITNTRMVAVTQPRRVAAISLANRVSLEIQDEIGRTCGYSVRFEDVTSEHTHIKFMTDGMLLQEGMRDPFFQKYSVIILDEVHERTINTDILLGQVKNAQLARAEGKKDTRLKIIIMSATMDVDKFSQHFNDAKVFYVEGRQYDISIFQTLKTQEDYCYSTLSLILKLHSELPPSHNILAFLTGQYEIESLVRYLKESYKDNISIPMEVYPLYAALSPDEQMKVLAPIPEGTRRVVISTNIAETSLTIPGIKVVIDCGYVKAKFHEYGLGLDTLGIVKVSKAQAMQRAGRAGRESGGKCYRLYSKEFFAGLDDNTVPEIQRVQLSRCILHLLKIGLQPFTFSWIDKPSEKAIAKALKELQNLNAIKVWKNKEGTDASELPIKSKITKLGIQIIAIPLEPTFASVLINAQEFQVVEPIACILSVLTSESIFRGKNEAIHNAMMKFEEPDGDLIMYLKIFRAFRKSKSKFEWCKLNSMNYRALSFAVKVHDHLIALCQREGMDLRDVSWEDSKENIRKCFHSCMSDNVAVLDEGKGNNYHIINREKLRVKIHQESSLHNKGCTTVHFTELLKVPSGTNYIKHVSLINSKWL